MRLPTAIAVALLVACASLSTPSAAAAAVPMDGDCIAEVIDTHTDHATARDDGELREPELNEPVAELPANAKGKGSPNFRATIPVYFHVVSPDGVTANVTQAQIDEQMRVMNHSFMGVYGGANTGFRFELVAVTRTTNAEWYNAAPGSPAEREMKKALTRNAPQALNYYSTTASYYLGWAYFPGLTDSRMFLDGIVVDWESMPGTSTRYAGRYDLGLTAVHEAGHWLGLHHTFNGGCNANGDYVDDTPKQRIPTRGCPEGQDSCSAPGVDPIHNYMDYSYDSCYFEFTKGQGSRMQDHYIHFRQ